MSRTVGMIPKPKKGGRKPEKNNDSEMNQEKNPPAEKTGCDEKPAE